MPSLDLYWVRIPLHEPFRISSGAVSVKDAILVEYEGRWGEASPMAGAFYSAETPESTWSALERMTPEVLRNPAVDLDSIVEGEPFAKAGMVGALLGAEWLEAKPRPVPSGVAIGIYDTTDELLERVERYLGEGYRRVKIKIQPGWDIEPVRRVRERFPSTPLMVDANAAYTLADAAVFAELDRFGLMMYEQPLGRHALEEMAELSRRVGTPICADESAESLDQLERIIALGAASIINVKIQRVGGLRNAVQMRDRARAAGLDCWVGTMPELGVASAEAIRLATLEGFVYPTDVESSARWYTDDIVDPPIAIDREGYLHAGAHRVDRAKLEKYTVRRACYREP
ncbi:MAG: o-succinylbenzoate synthase [Bryobacteraceae bacterium]